MRIDMELIQQEPRKELSQQSCVNMHKNQRRLAQRLHSFFFLQKIIITNRREGGTNFKTAIFFVESNQFSVHSTAVAKVQSHHYCTQKTLAKCVTLKVLMEPGTEQEVILGENWLPAACFV